MSSKELGNHPAVISFGHAIPDECVTNEMLAERATVEIDPDWIVDRTGINTRYWADKGEFASDLAVRAGRIALENAELEPDQLTGIVVASITADYFTPSVASIAHGRLAAPETCNAVDINAACAGGVKGLEIASALARAEEGARILVIGAEVLSKMVDLGDRKTLPLFGDGAAAAIVQVLPDTPPPHFVSITQPEKTDPMTISCPGGGMRAPNEEPVLRMPNGKAVAIGGGDIMLQSALRVAAKAGLLYDPANPGKGIDWTRIRRRVPHQANKRMLERLYDQLGVPEAERVYTVEKFGNTSAASALTGLSVEAEKGVFEQDDSFLMTAVGAGYVGGAALMAVRLNR